MPETKENTLLLKVTAGLLGVVGTLLTVISCLIMNKIDSLQIAVDRIGPSVTTNTANIATIKSDVVILQAEMVGMFEIRAQVQALYALKPERIKVHREAVNDN